jgi:RNA polymerase sigma-70 factor (ECF subfamily)
MDQFFDQDEAADPVTIGCEPGSQPPEPLRETAARLRALSTLLCLDVGLAEELVKITLIRASVGYDSARFDPSLTPWLYRRLRSYYYRDHAPQHEPRTPVRQAPGQSAALAALAELPVEQREALMLVEAGGFTPNEAAAICRCTRYRFREILRRARTGFARSFTAQGAAATNDTAAAVLFASAQAMA